MRRIGLIALLAAALAAGAAAPAANAGPACTATVDPAWVVDDAVVGWMVGTNAVQATCDPAWRRQRADRRPCLLHPLLGQRRRDGGVRAALPVPVADPRRLLDRDPGRPGEVRRRLLRPRAGHLPFRITLTRRAVYDIPGMPSAFRR
jgi:hypothetical protein